MATTTAQAFRRSHHRRDAYLKRKRVNILAHPIKPRKEMQTCEFAIIPRKHPSFHLFPHPVWRIACTCSTGAKKTGRRHQRQEEKERKQNRFLYLVPLILPLHAVAAHPALRRRRPRVPAPRQRPGGALVPGELLVEPAVGPCLLRVHDGRRDDPGRFLDDSPMAIAMAYQNRCRCCRCRRRRRPRCPSGRRGTAGR